MSEPRISSLAAGLIDALTARMSLRNLRTPATTDAAQIRSAAVAVVLHDPAAPRVLLMKRAERASDPWSGHISLPGGGFQPSDGDLRVTAIRETREELGVELTGARLLGNLETLRPRSSGPRGPGEKSIEVTPFVFVTDVALEPVCGPEALAAFWLPIELAASGALDSSYQIPSTELRFPSWSYEGHVIWGLTRRILDDLLAVGQIPSRAPPTILGR
ncbi:MAG TPA: CoA pyrophosphatase [Kofleriaceae bacterium]|nr:CoA pyrophosphatase [Kofleriaceae bacterium]